MKAVFFSDLHLKSPRDENSRAFVMKLLAIKNDEEVTHLFLLGDIFDLWVGPHMYFKNKWSDVVQILRKIAASGVQVHYFEGNHDLHLTRFWEDELGAQVHEGPQYFELDGVRMRIEHGDQMDREDKGYLFLRAFLRSWPMTWLAHHLPGPWVEKIGDKASATSRDYTTERKTTNEERATTMMMDHARRMYEKKPFDVLIAGHIHYKIDEADDAGLFQVRIINLGSWFDGPKSLVFNNREFKFV